MRYHIAYYHLLSRRGSMSCSIALTSTPTTKLQTWILLNGSDVTLIDFFNQVNHWECTSWKWAFNLHPKAFCQPHTFKDQHADLVHTVILAKSIFSYPLNSSRILNLDFDSSIMFYWWWWVVPTVLIENWQSKHQLVLNMPFSISQLQLLYLHHEFEVGII